jgi:carbon storage regulator
MLVLSRKIGEQIVIGNGEVVIEILSQKQGSIKLGFSAARNITIDRGEIHQLKMLGNLEVEHVRKQYA